MFWSVCHRHPPVLPFRNRHGSHPDIMVLYGMKERVPGRPYVILSRKITPESHSVSSKVDRSAMMVIIRVAVAVEECSTEGITVHGCESLGYMY